MASNYKKLQDSQKKPKVIICGAGIGGLTAAHELSKRDFEVVIYERNDIVGGLARSKYHLDKGNRYPVEYSWRIYGKEYKNLLRVMKEIPLHKKKTGSVFDNLIKICAYIFLRFDKEELIISPHSGRRKLIENFSLKDRLEMLDIIFRCLTMSKKRMDSLDGVKWKDYCRNLSAEAKKYMVQFWGPVLGMDMTYASFPAVSRMMDVLLGGYLGFVSSLFLMDKPTSEGWFDQWVAYMQDSRGVKIKTNCEVLDFEMKDKKICRISVMDHDKKKKIWDRADYYVCGMPIEAIAKIVSEDNELSRIPEMKNIIKLAKKSRQIQLSVQIFLDKKIKYPVKEKTILYLPDTPWSLIIEHEDKIWGNTFCTDENVKTVLSVGICQTDKPGIVFDKPFIRCTPEETKEEVWSQILRSTRMSNVRTENGERLDSAKIALFYVWDGFYFDSKEKKIKTREPKFSNNADALRYQPQHDTSIPNFFFATGYTKTDRFIYSMESAAEAGTLCANEILKKHDASLHLTKVYPSKTSSAILKPLIFADLVFYKLGLPHPSRLAFNSSIILTISYLAALIFCSIFLVVMLAVRL